MSNYTLNYTGEAVDKLLEKIDTSFGETTTETNTLTWDGNTEGLVSVNDTFYHVSDAVPTLEELQQGGTAAGTQNGTEMEIAFTSENVVDTGEGAIIVCEMCAIVAADNTTVESMGSITFPKAGVYFPKVVQDGTNILATQMTINGYTGFKTTAIKTLDPEFLPEPLRFGHEDILNKTNILEWDGVSAPYGVINVGSDTYYRISEEPIDKNDLIGGTIIVNHNGTLVEETITESFFVDLTADNTDINWSIVEIVKYEIDGVSHQSEPTWFLSFSEDTVVTDTLTYPKGVYTGRTIYSVNNTEVEFYPVKLTAVNPVFVTRGTVPIDTKYLPEHLQFGGSKKTIYDNVTVTLSSSQGAITDDVVELVAGNTYDLVWNGVEYNDLVCKEVGTPMGAVPYIGNAAVFEGDDTGESFVIVYAVEDGTPLILLYDYTSTLTEVTFTLNESSVKHINSDYLPEYLQPTVGTTSKVLVDNATVTAELDGNGYTAYLAYWEPLIKVDGVYTAVINGTEYKDVIPSLSEDGRSVYLALGDDKIQCLTDGSTIVYVNDRQYDDTGADISSISATVTLIDETAEKQVIKPESLPEHSHSWNDIEDRPFYDDSTIHVDVTITLSNTIDGRGCSDSPVEFNGVDFVDGQTYTVTAGNESVDGICSSDGDISITSLYGMSNVVINKNGITCDYPEHTEFQLTISSGGIKPIDKKYLPEALQFGEEENEIFPATEVSTSTMQVDPFELVEGETYYVYVDDVVYEAVCKVHKPTDYVILYYLGNYSAGTATEEVPFTIYSTYSETSASFTGSEVANISPATIKITKKDIVKLDSRYLNNVFVIDMTSSEYSKSDIAYGEKIKEALLNGCQIYIYDGKRYSTILGFMLFESTADTDELRIYYAMSESTANGLCVNTTPTYYSFAINK